MEDHILFQRSRIANNILASYSNDIHKSKAFIGEVRNWGGEKYQKQGSGKWKKITPLLNKKQHIVEHGNESGVDGVKVFESPEEAKKHISTLDHSDFDNPHSVTNYVSLASRGYDVEKLEARFEELLSDYEGEEDAEDQAYEDLLSELEWDSEEYIDYDSYQIDDHKNFDQINAKSDQLVEEAQRQLGSDLEGKYDDYQVESRGKGKYSYLDILDENNEVVKSIKLRIADHTYNPANNNEQERSGDFISVEIANDNRTEKRFNTKYSIQFDDSDNYQMIVESVKNRVFEIINTI